MDGGTRTLALGSRSGSPAALILWPALCTRRRARARGQLLLGRNRRSAHFVRRRMINLEGLDPLTEIDGVSADADHIANANSRYRRRDQRT
jgi:hypothetical protein